MSEKEKLNVLADAWVAKRFRDAARSYDNRLGMCLSAAMLMFIKADPRTQGEFIRQVFDQQVREEVDSLVQAVKEGRAAQTKQRGARERGAEK
jgi:hypothetical protein